MLVFSIDELKPLGLNKYLYGTIILKSFDVINDTLSDIVVYDVELPDGSTLVNIDQESLDNIKDKYNVVFK